MMTPTTFEQWCGQLGLPSTTGKLLTGIRGSPPVRRVTSRAKNVSGVYPGAKMNMTIQFESQVEQRAILVIEYDPEVLEFYDQPTTFQIHYQSGKKMVGPYYTPDFLVLRRTEAALNAQKAKRDSA